MVDPSLTPRRPILVPSGSAIPAENSGKIEGVSRPLSPDSVLHIRRAVWKPVVACAFLCAPLTDCGAIAAGVGAGVAPRFSGHGLAALRASGRGVVPTGRVPRKCWGLPRAL